MTLEQFLNAVDISKQSQKTQVQLLVHFNVKRAGVFNREDIKKWFREAELGMPTPANLSMILNQSEFYEKAENGFRFLRVGRFDLEQKFPQIKQPKKSPPSSDSAVLPLASIATEDDSILRIVNQINVCYDHECYDACAVMMRSLLEILLIRVYEHANEASKIETRAGRYKMLSQILDDAATNSALFPANVRKFFNKREFVDLGNYAVHEPEFLTQPEDIDRIRKEFRVAAQTLNQISKGATR